MKIVETNISYGYLKLIEQFMDANGLDVKCEEVERSRGIHKSISQINLIYDETSETALQITFMSTRHLGFENMLCDYLIRCGIPAQLIPMGSSSGVNRSMEELDRQWEEHRKKLGFR